MNKQQIINQELKFGVEAEGIIKPILEKYTGLLDTTPQYDNFDFVSDQFTIELKTRRNTKAKFYDTIIGKCKFEKAEEILRDRPDMRILFVFNFTDGIWYWEYDAKVANNFGERLIKRRDLGPSYKGQMYKLIPVNILKDLKDLN